MSKQIHFSVYFDTETNRFVIDDEHLMATTGTASWFDTETQAWVKPTEEQLVEDSRVNQLLANTLGVYNGDGLTYIAADGNYGDAGSLAIVDTTDWTPEDWATLEEESDWNMPDTAITIANIKWRESNA